MYLINPIVDTERCILSFFPFHIIHSLYRYVKILPRFSSAAKHMGYMISAIRSDTTETHIDIRCTELIENETKRERKKVNIVLTCNGHAEYCESIIFVFISMILCAQSQTSEDRRSDVCQKTHYAQGRSCLYVGCKVKRTDYNPDGHQRECLARRQMVPLSLAGQHPGGSGMLKGSGVGAPSSMQWANNPCLHPRAISQSVDARPIIISSTTMIPHMNAITCKRTSMNITKR